jgi:hypothetical protein
MNYRSQAGCRKFREGGLFATCHGMINFWNCDLRKTNGDPVRSGAAMTTTAIASELPSSSCLTGNEGTSEPESFLQAPLSSPDGRP